MLGQVVVDNLRTQLKDATKSFKDVLTLRTENLKGNEDRRKMFSASSSSPAAERSFGARSGELNQAKLLTRVHLHSRRRPHLRRMLR